MKVVKINQRINIMAGTNQVNSVGGNAELIYEGKGSSEGGRSRGYDDWDEE